MMLHTMHILIFGAVASLAAAASNSTNSTVNDLCASSQDIHFNSTGTIKVTFNDTNGQDPGDWYVSTTITQTLAPGNSEPQAKAMLLVQYISVPESWLKSDGVKDTQVCSYMSYNFNKTIEKSGEDSCDGVLDDKCIKTLQDFPAPENGDCGAGSLLKDCDDPFILNTMQAFNFSSANCSTDKLPDVNLPSGYRSFKVIPGLYLYAENSDDAFNQQYDLRVRQALPIMLSANFGKAGSKVATNNEVVCIATNNTVAGSRVPQSKFPESAASGLAASGRSAALSSMVVVSCLLAGLFY